MKNKLTYYFIFSVLLGSAIYTCEKLEIILPDFLRFYVNDFLIIPIVLTIVLWIVRKAKGNAQQQLSFWNIIYLCVLYSVLFEYWFPKYLVRYTFDLLDIVMYFIGGFVFYFLQKKNVVI